MSTAASSDQSCQKNLCQPVQHASVENQRHYERHRPEETTLYRLVQEHIETFFAQVETETGSELPDFVKDEFDAFLECGIIKKAPWRSSETPGIQHAISNAYLKSQGLYALPDEWLRLHHSK